MRQISSKDKASRAFSFERKIAELEKCGIAAALPHTSLSHLLSELRASVKKTDFPRLLLALARAPLNMDGNYSPQLSAFYDNCIEHENDYIEIMTMLAEQTRGALVLSDMSAHFPPEACSSFVPFHPARMEFKCNGRAYEYNFVQELDWIDLKLIEVFAALLSENQAELYYFQLMIDDTLLVGCLSLEHISRLGSLHGLKGIRLLSGRLPIDGLREV